MFSEGDGGKEKATEVEKNYEKWWDGNPLRNLMALEETKCVIQARSSFLKNVGEREKEVEQVERTIPLAKRALEICESSMGFENEMTVVAALHLIDLADIVSDANITKLCFEKLLKSSIIINDVDKKNLIIKGYMKTLLQSENIDTISQAGFPFGYPVYDNIAAYLMGQDLTDFDVEKALDSSDLTVSAELLQVKGALSAYSNKPSEALEEWKVAIDKITSVDESFFAASAAEDGIQEKGGAIEAATYSMIPQFALLLNSSAETALENWKERKTIFDESKINDGFIMEVLSNSLRVQEVTLSAYLYM